MANPKIKTLGEISKISGNLRKRGEKIISTNGVFDLIHPGHVRYLQDARKSGDVLVVGLNSDRSVRAIKGPKRPIIPQSQRAEVLAALEAVDYVCIFDENLPLKFLDAVKPHIHVKGGDYKPHELPERSIVERNGGKIITVPLVQGFSTTTIINSILKKYCK